LVEGKQLQPWNHILGIVCLCYKRKDNKEWGRAAEGKKKKKTYAIAASVDRNAASSASFVEVRFCNSYANTRQGLMA
jgi:hypothetical protein